MKNFTKNIYIYTLIYLTLMFYTLCFAETKQLNGSIIGIMPKQVYLQIEDTVKEGEIITVVRNNNEIAKLKVIKINGKIILTDIIQQTDKESIKFTDKLVKEIITEIPPISEQENNNTTNSQTSNTTTENTFPDHNTKTTETPATTQQTSNVNQNINSDKTSEISSNSSKIKSENLVTVMVFGKGINKEEALQDAFRNAVEKVTGVFIYSETEVKDFKLVKDKIIAISKGYVKDYEILEEKNFEGMTVLKTEIKVDKESIKTIMRQNIKVVTIEDSLKDFALVKQTQERLKKSAELIEVTISKHLWDIYNVDYIGYEIVDVNIDSVIVNLLINISLNDFYWETYYDVLKQVEDKSEKLQICGLFSYADDNGSLYSPDTFTIHPDLNFNNVFDLEEPSYPVNIEINTPTKRTEKELFEVINKNVIYVSTMYPGSVSYDSVNDSVSIDYASHDTVFLEPHYKILPEKELCKNSGYSSEYFQNYKKVKDYTIKLPVELEAEDVKDLPKFQIEIIEYTY